MWIRRLNEQGLLAMSRFLDALSEDPRHTYGQSVLTESETSEELPVRVEIERRSFPRSLDMARYLYGLLNGSGLGQVDRDKGLWAWLALFWFEQLCPADRDGRRGPGERARWIPAMDDARRYYRHLLLGRYLIFAAHAEDPDRAMAFLCQPLQTIGHMYYQLASRQQLIACRAVVESATLLYYDARSGRLRRNAQTYGAPGSVFRLADILMQLDRTVDLHSLTGSELTALLPEEFEIFLGDRTAAR